MKNIFNDVYIDCKFACLFNVFSYFNISPLYLLANNYYFISDKIQDIYFMDNNNLMASVNIMTRELAVIGSPKEIKLKNGEVVIIKGMRDGENQNHKCNYLITAINGNIANLIWRLREKDDEYGNVQVNISWIQKRYKDYIDKIYATGLDTEPTVTFFSKKDNRSQDLVLSPNYLSYRIFTENRGLIKRNGRNLLSLLLSNRSVEDKILVCSKLKKKKEIEKYKLEHGIGLANVLTVLNKQIAILEKLPLQFMKHSEHQLVEELCLLEDKIFQHYDMDFSFNMIAEQCIQIKKKLSLDNIQHIAKGRVLTTNKQNNSVNGIFLKDGEKCFYKIQKTQNHFTELYGYYQLCLSFPVPDLLFAAAFDDYGIIIYKYEESVGADRGLLIDLLSSNNSSEALDFLEYIKSNYCKKKVQTSYPMQMFFEDRVESRLIKYLDYTWVNKRVDIGVGRVVRTKDIINECVSYFNKQRTYTCVLTHGDLNTMNIGIRPVFFDFVTSGYNYINAEIATFSISTLFVDLFFSPKYHKESFQNHEKICEMVPNVDVDFFVDEDTIEIKSKPMTQAKRRVIIESYLTELEYEPTTLVYYIIMRLLTIFDIEKYEIKDKMYALFLVHFFYHQMRNQNFIDIIRLIETG